MSTGPKPLPFASASFDAIICGSVLEYVAPDLLTGVFRELDRVLRGRGVLLVKGTSSRLWPREVHSGRWFVNYLPRFVDRSFCASRLQRGIWPWQIVRGFRGYRDLIRGDGGRAYLRAHREAGGARTKRIVLGGVASAVSRIGWSVGMLTPSIFLALEKPPTASETIK